MVVARRCRWPARLKVRVLFRLLTFSLTLLACVSSNLQKFTQKPFRALRNTPYWRYETAPKNDAVYPCGSVVLTKRDVRSIVPTARDP